MKQNINLLIGVFRVLQVGASLIILYSIYQLLSQSNVNIKYLGQEFGLQKVSFNWDSLLSVALFFSPYLLATLSIQILIQVMKKIRKEDFFTKSTISGIQLSAKLFLLMSLLVVLANIAAITLHVLRGNTTMEVALILFTIGISLRVISKILQRAKRLQEENQLTI